MSTNTTTSDSSTDSNQSAEDASLLNDDLYTKENDGDELPEDIVREFNPSNDVTLKTLDLSEEQLTSIWQDEWEDYVGNVDDYQLAPKFTGKVNIDILSLISNHYTPIINESKVLFTTEGIFIRTKDPANIVMMTAWIDRDDFEEYNVEREGVLAIKWNETTGDMINQVNSGEVVDVCARVNQGGSKPESNNKSAFNEPFELANRVPKSFDTAAKRIKRKLDVHKRIELVIDDGIKMITDDANPEPLRDEPDKLDIERSCQISLTGSELDNILSRISEFSDVVSLEYINGENAVQVQGEGDTATIEKTYDNEGDIAHTDSIRRFDFECEGDEDAKTHYSIEYLVDLLKGVKKSNLKSKYNIRFGSETPLMIKTTLGSESFIKTEIAHKVV